MSTVETRAAGFSRAVWTVLGGDLVSAIGTGATLPYLFVYLHKITGASVALVGGIMTVRAVLAIVGAVISGPLTDRLGARRAAGTGLLAAAGATFLLGYTDNAIMAVAAVVVIVVAANVIQVGLDALLAELAVGAVRARAYSWRRVVAGLGGAGGAGLATAAIYLFGLSSGLRTAYVFDGVSFGVFAVLVTACVQSSVVGSDVPAGSVGDTAVDGSAARGYRAVFGHRPMRWTCAIVALASGAGFAQVEVALPALVSEASSSVSALGWMAGANMIALVVLPIPVQRITGDWNRVHALIPAFAAMILAWLLVLPTSGGPAVLAAVGVLFALAEMIVLPLSTMLVNDLARPGLVGRYNGAQMIAWTSGWLAGTAAVSLAVALAPDHADRVLVGCIAALAAATLALRPLARSLPPTVARPGRAA